MQWRQQIRIGHLLAHQKRPPICRQIPVPDRSELQLQAVLLEFRDAHLAFGKTKPVLAAAQRIASLTLRSSQN